MAKIYHTKSGASEKAIKALVQKFKDGDLSSIADGIKFQVPEEFPSSGYTMRNRLMAYLQCDSIVTGSYQFWKKHGRYPEKGTGAYIFAPMKRQYDDKDTEEKKWFVYGFRLIPTYPIEGTSINEKFEGEPIQVPELTPADLPPLMNVAKQLGLDVNWKPVPAGRWADYGKTKRKRINMGTNSPKVYFHELAHALHEAVDSKFKERDTVFKEVVAEFGSAVMMKVYLNEDSSKNAWEYIKHFSDNPSEAIEGALGMIQKMFGKLDQLQEVANEAD